MSLRRSTISFIMSSFEEYANGYTVSQSSTDIRSQFIKKTYIHLALALLALAAIDGFILNTPALLNPLLSLFSGGKMGMLIVFGLYVGVSFLAQKWANSSTSKTIQYVGLATYVAVTAVIFVPLLYMAQRLTGDSSLITQAALATAGLFLGLTAVAFTTKKDFSFMGGFLRIGGFVVLGLIVASMIFGFSLGIWFSGAMILFMGGAILYDTSNVMHHYRSDQYVAASLSLFASVAMLFYYMLRFLMSLASND